VVGLLEPWLDSPFLGVPSGVIADAVRSGAIPAWAAASAHNALLDALARTGLVGAALVIATAVVAVWLAIRAARWGQVMPIGVLGLLIVSGFSEALVSWQWPSASTTLLLLAVVGSLGPERPQAAGLDQRTEIASSTEA
jgi:O-antigen ligase